VEYYFSGIRQVNVDAAAGLSFAAAVRAFLRQDPDVIVVGEIRDREAAGVAVQAALTGHLVIGTMHTSDSASTFTRLIEMGLEPFLVSSSLLAVVSQRIVRTICNTCKQPYTPPRELLADLRLDARALKGFSFMKGRGCKDCGYSGYKGSTGIYEMMRLSPAVQEAILKRSSAEELRTIAAGQGCVSLRQAGVRKLLSGLTTAEEVFRVTLE